MKYEITIARKYINEKGEPDYEGTTGFEINSRSLANIMKAMDLLGIEIWKTDRDRCPVWKSPMWVQIEGRRIKKTPE